MKTLGLVVAFIGVFVLILTGPAFAAVATTSHAVTITTPDVLTFTADTGAFTLTFPDYIAGTLSDSKIVTYTFKANNLAQLAGAAVVSAKLDVLFTGADLKMDPGAYTKAGGNASLTENAVGFITLATTDTPAMKKVVDIGSGKTSRGTFPITYQATATADLEPGSPLQTLTVTATNV